MPTDATDVKVYNLDELSAATQPFIDSNTYDLLLWTPAATDVNGFVKTKLANLSNIVKDQHNHSGAPPATIQLSGSNGRSINSALDFTLTFSDEPVPGQFYTFLIRNKGAVQISVTFPANMLKPTGIVFPVPVMAGEALHLTMVGSNGDPASGPAVLVLTHVIKVA